MKLNLSSIGKECPKCRRTIDKNVVAKISEIKKQNALRSSKLAKENGNTTGRPTKVNWDKVREMRSKYMTITDIAKNLGLRREYISMAMKKRGIK